MLGISNPIATRDKITYSDMEKLPLQATQTGKNLKSYFKNGLICFTFVLGLIVGFNLRDLMLNTCKNVQLHRQTTVPRLVKPSSDKVALPVNPQTELKKREKPKPKVAKVFKKLPEKYLINVPPKRPAAIFSIEPWKYIARNERYFITFLIKSAAPLVQRRFLIRRTWGSVEKINNQRFGIIFLIGMTRTKIEQNLLEQESSLYGDILQSDVMDNYFNLPKKVLAAFQWVTYGTGNISDYYITTDDDCVANIPEIFDVFYLNKEILIKKIYCAYIYDSGHAPSRRKNFKWGVSPEVYSGDVYPIFCHGGMTVWPFSILTDVYHTSETTNYTQMHLEDVLITGILRQKTYNSANNIIGRGYQRLKRKFRKRPEPYVYHLGLSKNLQYSFNMRWHQSTAGLRIGPDDHLVGKRSSAFYFNATISKLILLPGADLTQTLTYFSSKWAMYRPKRKRIKRPLPEVKPISNGSSSNLDVDQNKNQTKNGNEEDFEEEEEEEEEERPLGNIKMDSPNRL